MGKIPESAPIYPPKLFGEIRETNDAPVQRIILLAVPTGKRNSEDAITNLIQSDQIPGVEGVIERLHGIAFIPEALVPSRLRDQFPQVSAISDGFRSSTINPLENSHLGLGEFPVRLGDMGIVGPDADLIAKAAFGVKGSGTVYNGLTIEDAVVKLLLDPTDPPQRAEELVEQLSKKGAVILPRRLMQDEGDERAVGGDLAYPAAMSLDMSGYLLASKIDFKIFPTLYVAPLPQLALFEMWRLAKDLGIPPTWGRRIFRQKDGEKFHRNAYRLGQEIRLVFSQVRAYGLTQDDFSIEDGIKRFETLGITTEQYRSKIASIWRRDARRMMDFFATYTGEKDSSYGYFHNTFREMLTVFGMSNAEWDNYDTCWYLTKDMALAPTGVYFADLEGIGLFVNSKKDDSVEQTKRFLAEHIKEWLRLMTHVKLVVNAIDDLDIDFAVVERNEYQLLLEELAKSEFCRFIQERDESLLFRLSVKNYAGEEIAMHDIIVPKANIHFQYQDET